MGLQMTLFLLGVAVFYETLVNTFIETLSLCMRYLLHTHNNKLTRLYEKNINLSV